MTRMILWAAIIAVVLAGSGAIFAAEPVIKSKTGEADEYDGLPNGLGRDEVYFACQACHSLAIVKQQGLNRESWDETLVWMVEEQEMDPLDSEDRKLILDYLSTHFGRGSSKYR